MADEVVKGTNGFTLAKQKKQWSKERGWYVAKVYQGPQALAETFAATLIQSGADTIDIETGVPCVIDCTFPLVPSGYNEDTKASEDAVWELIGEPVEKRLESHGKFNYSGSSQAVLEKIDKAIRDGTASDTAWDTVYAGLGLFNNYRDLRLMGVDSYESYIWRVRKTMTVSRVSLLKPVFTNIGKIVSWATVGVPATAQFGQPTIHMVKPLNSGSWTDEAVDEWLIQPPSVRWMKGAKKWAITQEWVGAVSVSSTLYEGGSMTP